MNGNFDYDKMMSDYKARLKKGAFLKALMIGLLSGFGAMLLYALVDWMVGLKLFYIGIAVMVGVAAAVTAILYFVAFYPTDVKLRALSTNSVFTKEWLPCVNSGTITLSWLNANVKTRSLRSKR